MILVLWNFIYRILHNFTSLYSSIFPKANLLGFNLWGRGLVTRKCTPRKTGTVLEPCWNLSLLGCKVGLIHGLCLQEIDRNAAPCNCKHVTLPSVFQSLNDLAQRLQSVTFAITSDLAKCLSKLDIWQLQSRVTLPNVFQSLTFAAVFSSQASSFNHLHPSYILDLLSVLGISMCFMPWFSFKPCVAMQFQTILLDLAVAVVRSGAIRKNSLLGHAWACLEDIDWVLLCCVRFQRHRSVFGLMNPSLELSELQEATCEKSTRSQLPDCLFFLMWGAGTEVLRTGILRYGVMWGATISISDFMAEQCRMRRLVQPCILAAGPEWRCVTASGRGWACRIHFPFIAPKEFLAASRFYILGF